MRIRKNSQFTTLPHLKEVCILNQNPWDIFSWTDHESAESLQIVGGNDASFQSSNGLNSEMVVKCSMSDERGFMFCESDAKEGCPYCEVHMQQLVMKNSISSCCDQPSTSSANRVALKRKQKADSAEKVDSSPAGSMIYYAGYPGLRKKRCPPPTEAASEDADVDESQ